MGQIQAAAQLVDDADALVQRLRLARDLAAIDVAARDRHALECAVHQHQYQPMRIGAGDAAVD